jgi:hypothetical protein
MTLPMRIAFTVATLALSCVCSVTVAQQDAGSLATGAGRSTNPPKPPNNPQPRPAPWPTPPPGPTWSVGQSATREELENYRSSLEDFRKQVEKAREASGGEAGQEYRNLLDEYKTGVEKYHAGKTLKEQSKNDDQG